MHVASLDIIHFKLQIIKAQIRVHQYVGWCAPLLFVCNNIRFSSNEANTVEIGVL